MLTSKTYIFSMNPCDFYYIKNNLKKSLIKFKVLKR